MFKSGRDYSSLRLLKFILSHSRVWADRKDIKDLYTANAKASCFDYGSITKLNCCLQFFTCGAGKVASGIKEKLVAILQEGGDLTEAEALAKFESVTKGRYATDIFD